MADATQSPLDLARNVVAAWEALPGGRNYGPKVVESWLVTHMAPMVNDLRSLIIREEAEEVDAWERHYRVGFEDGEKHAAGGLADAQSQAFTYKRILDELSEKKITRAVIDVVKEHRRQVEAEGWTTENDDRYEYGQIAKAASCYAYEGSRTEHQRSGDVGVPPLHWPWSERWWKPTTPRRDLVKAAALLLAEIERIDRAATKLASGKD